MSLGTDRAAFFVRIRGAAKRGQTPDYDKGIRLYGESLSKGIEVLAASDEGAVIIRLRGESNGSISLAVSLIPWTDWTGQSRGGKAILYKGPIRIPNLEPSKEPDPQLPMFGD